LAGSTVRNRHDGKTYTVSTVAVGPLAESRIVAGGRFRAMLTLGAGWLKFFEQERVSSNTTIQDLHDRVVRMASLDKPAIWTMTMEQMLQYKEMGPTKVPHPEWSLSRIHDDSRRSEMHHKRPEETGKSVMSPATANSRALDLGDRIVAHGQEVVRALTETQTAQFLGVRLPAQSATYRRVWQGWTPEQRAMRVEAVSRLVLIQSEQHASDPDVAEFQAWLASLNHGPELPLPRVLREPSNDGDQEVLLPQDRPTTLRAAPVVPELTPMSPHERHRKKGQERRSLKRQRSANKARQRTSLGDREVRSTVLPPAHAQPGPPTLPTHESRARGEPAPLQITLDIKNSVWIAVVEDREYPLTSDGTPIPLDTPLDILRGIVSNRYPQAEVWLGEHISKNPSVQNHIDNGSSR